MNNKIQHPTDRTIIMCLITSNRKGGNTASVSKLTSEQIKSKSFNFQANEHVTVDNSRKMLTDV